jgi:hypothetical protein
MPNIVPSERSTCVKMWQCQTQTRQRGEGRPCAPLPGSETGVGVVRGLEREPVLGDHRLAVVVQVIGWFMSPSSRSCTIDEWPWART